MINKDKHYYKDFMELLLDFVIYCAHTEGYRVFLESMKEGAMSEERDKVLHEGLYNYAVEAEEELDTRLRESGYQ